MKGVAWVLSIAALVNLYLTLLLFEQSERHERIIASVASTAKADFELCLLVIREALYTDEEPAPQRSWQ